MTKPTKLKGRLWVLTDPDGNLYDDIDTDMIFHNRYLHITDVAQMGQYALDNLAGWEDFAQRAQPGDIILAGKNFGAGSSRQQAVDCFRALGIGAIIAESYGAIYKRNAINSGLPIVSLPDLTALAVSTADEFKTGDSEAGAAAEARAATAEVEVDFKTGQVVLNDSRSRFHKKTFHGQPFSQVQMDIYQAGNLFAYGKALGE